MSVIKRKRLAIVLHSSDAVLGMLLEFWLLRQIYCGCDETGACHQSLSQQKNADFHVELSISKSQSRKIESDSPFETNASFANTVAVY